MSKIFHNSLFPFTTVISKSITVSVTANATVNLVFLVTNGIAKMSLKTMGRKTEKLLYWPELN